MIGAIVLAGIAAAVLALYYLPLRVRAEYSETGPQVDAALGPLRIALFPRPEKSEKSQTPKKKKKKPDEPNKTKEKSGGNLPLFRQLIGLALEFLGKFWRKLHMDQLTLHLTVGGDKALAADAALLYGRAWAAVGALVPLMEQVLIIGKRDIQVEIDYRQQEDKIYVCGIIRIFLGELLELAIPYGLRALKIFVTHKMQKGGKKNGTSNQ